jgi:hypothetical protein
MVTLRGKRDWNRQNTRDRHVSVTHYDLLAIAHELQIGGELILQSADIYGSHEAIIPELG